MVHKKIGYIVWAILPKPKNAFEKGGVVSTFVVVTIDEAGTLDTWGPFRSDTRAAAYAATFDSTVDVAVHLVHSVDRTVPGW